MNPINKILLGAGAALILAVAATIVWLLLLNAHLRVQIAQAQRDSAACHVANDNFAVSVEKQNEAVRALQKRAVLREKLAQAESYKAQQAARQWFLAADKIGKERISGDACQSASRLLDDYLGGQK